jgi:enoyl-CoA hydratase/carnithine racemase
MSGTVHFETLGDQGAVALIRLARPEKANAYTQPMLARLSELLTGLAADESVRALVLIGSDRHFCAGADRSELDARRGQDALDLLSRRTFDQLARMPQPVIAAIEGAAVAGGFELALACDFRICTPDARFALPETKLGLIPAAGGMRRLVQQIGAARTKELVLLGRELDAATAQAWGIVNAIEADVLAAAVAMASSLRARDAVAQRLAKTAIDATGSGCDVALEGAMQAFLYERRGRR